MDYVELKVGTIYGIPLANGVLRLDVSCDDDYPGIDIEFIPNEEREIVTRPRVLIESPIAEDGTQENLRVLVWADAKSEDYTDAIEFSDAQMCK